jgi:hypothetical protein
MFLGLNKVKAAKDMGYKSHQMLHKIEKGEIRINYHDLSKIALVLHWERANAEIFYHMAQMLDEGVPRRRVAHILRFLRSDAGLLDQADPSLDGSPRGRGPDAPVGTMLRGSGDRTWPDNLRGIVLKLRRAAKSGAPYVEALIDYLDRPELVPDETESA